MKPSKSDFLSLVHFSENIKDAAINIHIDDAFKYDVKPKLDTLATDIWNYKSDDKPQLEEFYQEYVLPWWVLLAYKRFIQLHGRNVTQFGYTKTRDPQGTFDQLNQEERAVIMKQIDHDAAVLFNYILQQEWKFDNVSYRKYRGCSPRTSGSYGINAIE